jgi:DNA processing protein
VVVEGAERSGSLITADFAAALGREVAAVPGRATSPRTRGSNGLLRDGATVVLEVGDVLDAIFGAERGGAGGGSSARDRGGRAPWPDSLGLAPELACVLDAVADGRDRLDVLARTPAEADAAMLALAELELRGLVRRAAGVALHRRRRRLPFARMTGTARQPPVCLTIAGSDSGGGGGHPGRP